MFEILLELFVGHVVLCNLHSRASYTMSLRCATNENIKNDSKIYNKPISHIMPKVSTNNRRTGNDERYIKYYENGYEHIEEEYNFHKQEKYAKMLEKLKKIDGMIQKEELLSDVYEFLKDKDFIEEIRSFRIMNGGLLDKWEEDCWDE
jgi:hypothetical protein